jgi:hypothetical protein
VDTFKKKINSFQKSVFEKSFSNAFDKGEVFHFNEQDPTPHPREKWCTRGYWGLGHVMECAPMPIFTPSTGPTQTRPQRQQAQKQIQMGWNPYKHTQVCGARMIVVDSAPITVPAPVVPRASALNQGIPVPSALIPAPVVPRASALNQGIPASVNLAQAVISWVNQQVQGPALVAAPVSTLVVVPVPAIQGPVVASVPARPTQMNLDDFPEFLALCDQDLDQGPVVASVPARPTQMNLDDFPEFLALCDQDLDQGPVVASVPARPTQMNLDDFPEFLALCDQDLDQGRKHRNKSISAPVAPDLKEPNNLAVRPDPKNTIVAKMKLEELSEKKMIQAPALAIMAPALTSVGHVIADLPEPITPVKKGEDQMGQRILHGNNDDQSHGGTPERGINVALNIEWDNNFNEWGQEKTPLKKKRNYRDFSIVEEDQRGSQSPTKEWEEEQSGGQSPEKECEGSPVKRKLSQGNPRESVRNLNFDLISVEMAQEEPILIDADLVMSEAAYQVVSEAEVSNKKGSDGSDFMCFKIMNKEKSKRTGEFETQGKTTDQSYVFLKIEDTKVYNRKNNNNLENVLNIFHNGEPGFFNNCKKTLYNCLNNIMGKDTFDPYGARTVGALLHMIKADCNLYDVNKEKFTFTKDEKKWRLEYASNPPLFEISTPTPHRVDHSLTKEREQKIIATIENRDSIVCQKLPIGIMPADARISPAQPYGDPDGESLLGGKDVAVQPYSDSSSEVITGGKATNRRDAPVNSGEIEEEIPDRRASDWDHRIIF